MPGRKGKGKEAHGEQAKSPAAALVPRLGVGGLGAEGFWSSLLMILQWDKTLKVKCLMYNMLNKIHKSAIWEDFSESGTFSSVPEV